MELAGSSGSGFEGEGLRSSYCGIRSYWLAVRFMGWARGDFVKLTRYALNRKFGMYFEESLVRCPFGGGGGGVSFVKLTGSGRRAQSGMLWGRQFLQHDTCRKVSTRIQLEALEYSAPIVGFR